MASGTGATRFGENSGWSSAPAMALFSANPHRSHAVVADIEAAGARVTRRGMLADAIEERTAPIGVKAVMVHVDDLDGHAQSDFEEVLIRLDATAGAHSFDLLVDVPAHLIDSAATCLRSAHSTLLSRPTSLQRVAAVALAICGQPGTAVADVGDEASVTRLRQLSEEVGRIARTLASLSQARDEGDGTATGRPLPPGEEPIDAGQAAAMLRSILRGRRLRDQFFPAEIFSDPAWDMLLDLMASRLEAKRVAVSSLCIAAAVPATTALRWIKTMTEEGLFVRRADPQDGRRIFIDLSDAAADGMSRYLAQLRRSADLPV